ncbi:MAG: TldD/PmbA family protein [Methanomassiliicoccales archaeon]
MKAEDICQLILSTCKSLGAHDVVVSVTQSESSMIRFSNNEITINKELRESTVNLYVNEHGRRASTSTANLSKRSLESMAKKTVETARKSPIQSIYAPLPKGPFKYDYKLLNCPLINSDPKMLVSMVHQAIESAIKEGAERVAGALVLENNKLTLHTSADAFGMMRKSGLEVSLRAFCGGSSGHSVSVSGNEKNFEPIKAGEEAGRLAKLSVSPSTMEPGLYDVVFGPLTFASFINQLGRSASAFMVEAGLSFLSEKLGNRIGPEELNVYDDPTLQGTYGAAAFDAEGLPCRKNVIIERGVLKTYLHNSTTAAKVGVESTANAGLISPRAFNLVVEEGKHSTQELIKSVDKGIFVSNNWYLRYQNYTTGDFSTIPRDAMFLIENGEFSKPIRELRISDNMNRIFKSILGLSKERKWVHWWEVETPTLSPSALIGGVRFTKSR